MCTCSWFQSSPRSQPFQFQDTLAKQQGYTPEAPAGLIPPFKTGLTPEAELINGRLAMLGVIAIHHGISRSHD